MDIRLNELDERAPDRAERAIRAIWRGVAPPPSVSVVIAASDCEATIGRAITSALCQDLDDVEVVVVNDASTDRTGRILAALAAADPRIVYAATESNIGVGAARNLGIALASAPWIAMLDAADWIRPNRLSRMLHAANRLNADIVCDRLRLYDHALDRVVGVMRFVSGGTPSLLNARTLFERDHALRRHPLRFAKPMIRADFLKKSQLAYDPDLRSGADFHFLAQALFSGARAFILPSADYVHVPRQPPSDRASSPIAGSDRGFADMRRCCHRLYGLYRREMTRAERRALAARRKSIADWTAYLRLRAAIGERRLFKAVSIIDRQPGLALVGFRALWSRLQDWAMIWASRFRNRSEQI